MKRCPTCNQTFTEQWLGYCTNDGTVLVDAGDSGAVRPTAEVTPPRPTAPAAEQPTIQMSASYVPPPTQYAPPPSAPMGWQPPPPPALAVAGQQQSLAIASMVLGIVSITVGWCCSFGLLTSPIAIGLGIYQLVQIKNKPTEFGGKPYAIAGIATGAVSLGGLVIFLLIYGMAALMQGFK